MKRFKKGIVLFHRDLRVEDNTTLTTAMAQCEQVMPVFIFDPVQVDKDNKYKSSNAVEFMVASLHDLAGQIRKHGGKLYCFYGDTHAVIQDLIKKTGVDAVFSHKDYTPFASNRDSHLSKEVQKAGASYSEVQDLLLTNPDQLLSGGGTPYKVYTAFLKKAVTVPVVDPVTPHSWHWYTEHIAHEKDLTNIGKTLFTENKHIFQTGGSAAAHKILRSMADFKHYSEIRNNPSLATTGLSAHIKFGTVSIRQVYDAMKKHKVDAQLIKQLYWRDFFTAIAYHFPHVFGKTFVEKYNDIAWSHNKAWFERWCEGTTGFPFVDAGMRQLNSTGFMHNRLRMVVASFLTKDMLIDWRWGERYFAQQLTDYDPAVNNGNWQWSASTGADAQPYFRIFNPWLQQKRFDPECLYIKKWVPELAGLAPKAIHGLSKATLPYNGYPAPMFDHGVQSKQALKMFKECS